MVGGDRNLAAGRGAGTAVESGVSIVAPPDLTVVVLAWDQLELTRACVASLRAHTDVAFELIVVDNGSAREAAAFASEAADVAVLNAENRGFAAGMNQGLEAATGRLVAFVNNDTVFPPQWASRLVATMDGVPDAGLVLPAVTAAGNQASVRQEPGDGVVTFPPFRAIPSGVVYLARRDVMEELGGWNERYPVASGEDLDLLFTFWSNGLAVVLDERVLVEHVSAATIAAKLPNRSAVYRANRLLFARRWSVADPADIPRLAACPPDRFAANLEQARIAGTWMRKWFEAMDAAAEAQRPARQAPAPPPPPAPKPARRCRLAERCPLRRAVSRLRARLRR